MQRFDRIILLTVAGLAAAIALLILITPVQAPSPPDDVLRLIYLVAGAEDTTEIWELGWETRNSQAGPVLPGPALNFALAPPDIPGTARPRLILPVGRAEGGHDLWLVEGRRTQRWLACAPDDCSHAAWAPDGSGAIYTRESAQIPTLWWVDGISGETQPFFAEEISQGRYVAWSPGGKRLAYSDPVRGVCVVTLDQEDLLCIPALMEAPAVWAPDGTTLLVTDMRLSTGYASNILRVDVVSGEFVDLSQSPSVEDDAPVWSPDGVWIAFRRRIAGAPMGKQLWLMKSDGSELHALTKEADIHHGPPIWTLDGRTVLTTRYDGESPGSIWAIAIATGEMELVAAEGYHPRWLLP